MTFRLTGYRWIAVIFWALTVLAIAIWSFVPGYVIGWDLRACTDAIHSLKLGHDPYADGVAALEGFQSQLASHPNSSPPFIYVYGPITLPLLKLVGLLPLWLAGTGYWLLIAAGALVSIWAGMQLLEDEEGPVFFLLAPVVIFFPGLIQNDAFFSGNVAYILYGLILGAATVGWRKDRWGWFYAAVLLAACFKAPLLALLMIPLLSARRQWVPAGLTVVAWAAVFGAEWMVWPAESANYMRSLDRMFTLSRDFSSSPAGLVADALYGRVPYQLVLAGVYLMYAIPIVGTLFYLSRRFFSGQMSREQWIPVMLIGVILLNPRIQEYDVAPITIAMALVAWRVLSRGGVSLRSVVMRSAFCFAAANILGAYRWRATECLVLVGLFMAGAWCLSMAPSAESAVAPAEIEESELAAMGWP